MPSTLPSRDPNDLGPTLRNTRASQANELTAVLVEAIKSRIIEMGAEIGLPDGSTPASIYARRSIALAATQTGNSPLTIGALYLPKGHLISVGSRALIGTVDGGTVTLRLRSQITAAVLAIWERAGSLADVTLVTPATAPDTDWYSIEIVGDAESTVSLAFGLHLI